MSEEVAFADLSAEERVMQAQAVIFGPKKVFQTHTEEFKVAAAKILEQYAPQIAECRSITEIVEFLWDKKGGNASYEPDCPASLPDLDITLETEGKSKREIEREIRAHIRQLRREGWELIETSK